jgi:tRNA threonylcarbamoyladenosine biosynthesis protein TsaE
VLWLVEWPERGAGALPPTDLVVALEIEGQGRRARLSGLSDAGREWLQRLAEGGDLRPVSVA